MSQKQKKMKDKNDKRLQALEKKATQVFLKAFFTGQLQPMDFAKLSIIFGDLIYTADEFVLAIKIFQDDFPVLGEILREEEESMREDKESVVEDFMKVMIQKDPGVAARIGQMVSEDKDFSLDKMKDLFPEFGEFLIKRNKS